MGTDPVQGQRPCAPRSQVLLSPDRPSVFFSYDRLAVRSKTPVRLAEAAPPSDKSESADLKDANVVLLRLHNNTSWTIGFPTESMYVGPAVTAWSFCDGTGVLGLRDGIEVNGRYELELLQDETKAGSRSAKHLTPGRTDVFSTSWLPPGRSVIIAVLKEHLKKGRYLSSDQLRMGDCEGCCPGRRSAAPSILLLLEPA